MTGFYVDEKDTWGKDSEQRRFSGATYGVGKKPQDLLD